MTAKGFSETLKNLTRPIYLQQEFYYPVAALCNVYRLIIPFDIHKALTSMNCSHWQTSIQFLRNSMQKVLSHNYPLISLTAFSPTAAASPSMKSDWCLLHILKQIHNPVVQYNCIHSRTLYFLHRLIVTLQIQRIYNSKLFLQDWKGRIFHQTPKFLHRSSCLQTSSYLSFPKNPRRVTISVRTAVPKGSSCPSPSWPVTRKGWAQFSLEHENNFETFPFLQLSDGCENDQNLPELLQLELKSSFKYKIY